MILCFSYIWEKRSSLSLYRVNRFQSLGVRLSISISSLVDYFSWLS